MKNKLSRRGFTLFFGYFLLIFVILAALFSQTKVIAQLHALQKHAFSICNIEISVGNSPVKAELPADWSLD